MPQFFKLCGTKPFGAHALKTSRWPEGFACPRCASAAQVQRKCRPSATQVKRKCSALCLANGFPQSLSMQRLSALSLKHHLGLSYPRAYLVHHKLMQAMTQGEAR